MAKSPVSRNIRALLARAEPPLRQVDLADALDLPPSQISARLNGRLDWREPELHVVAGVLQVPVTTLFAESLIPDPAAPLDAEHVEAVAS
jgi:hypothetical protein